MSARITRRTMLRGFGTALALPWLESMIPSRALAAAAGAGEAPLRMAFLFVPNGVWMREWTPKKEGRDFDFPSTVKPLEPLKDDLLFLTGLTHDKARANGDGPGDHARSASAFLTGCQANKTDGANIHVGVSVDQLVAQRIGSLTRFPSLEISTDGGRDAGGCDSGYSCAYSNNISWRSPETPAAKETNPQALFDRLFGSDSGQESAQARMKRTQAEKSILDFVLDDAKSLRNRVSTSDQRKLDEYLTSVREVEERLSRTEKAVARLPNGIVRPQKTPADFEVHLRLLADVLVLAFQTDSTRIATFMFAREGSNRAYPNLGVSSGHHDLSHHQGDKSKYEKLMAIDRFHVTQLAYFLDRMRSIREGEGTLLDHSMIVYGAAIGDGNRHNHDDLAVLLAGRGNGTIKTGRHVRVEGETPMTNLFLSMMDRVGVHEKSFGDSTGRLNVLS